MRRLRFIPSGGSLVEVSSRTHEGRFYLHPGPELGSLVLGVLGRAQRRYGVAIHAFVFLSNHFHMLITVSHALQIARFMGYLNSQLARRVHRLRGGRDALWARRYSLSLVSSEPNAQIARLLYLLRQGVKEGLVADPLDWSGPSSWAALASGKPLVGSWIPLGALRPEGSLSNQYLRAEEEVVHLSPLPAWSHLSEELQREKFLELLELVRIEGRDRRNLNAEPARQPLTLKPHPAPQRTDPLPLVHAASGSVRRLYDEAYRAFVGAYQKASDALKKGIQGIAFPEGSFPRPAPFVYLAPT